MRYRLTVPLEGVVVLRDGKREVRGRRDGIDFALIADERGRVTHVVVETTVPEDKLDSFKSSIGPGVHGTAATVHLGGDPQLFQKLIEALRVLESHLAFETPGAIRQINFRERKHEYVPEIDAERSAVPVFAYEMKQAYPETPALVTEKGFRDFINSTPPFDELVAVKSFWQEGLNRFQQLQYVQAFHQFYFVIEGFFADGKSSERKVLKAFNRSTELTAILESALKTFSKPADRHSVRLQELMALEKCEASVEGLRRFLIRVRGRLHHYSASSSSPTIHPHNQEAFETAALVAMFISRMAIDRRVIAIRRKNA